MVRQWRPDVAWRDGTTLWGAQRNGACARCRLEARVAARRVKPGEERVSCGARNPSVATRSLTWRVGRVTLSGFWPTERCGDDVYVRARARGEYGLGLERSRRRVACPESHPRVPLLARRGSCAAGHHSLACGMAIMLNGVARRMPAIGLAWRLRRGRAARVLHRVRVRDRQSVYIATINVLARRWILYGLPRYFSFITGCDGIGSYLE